jgi:hypothetical protein
MYTIIIRITGNIANMMIDIMIACHLPYIDRILAPK